MEEARKGQRNCGGNRLSLLRATHPLQCTSGEEWQDEGEGPDEEAWNRIDDRDLLKNLSGLMERAQERNIAIADVECIPDEKVRKAIAEAAAQWVGT